MVLKDVETYAKWAIESSNPGLAIHGIFFDETPEEYDEDAAKYLQELTDTVKGLPSLGPDNFVRIFFFTRFSTFCPLYTALLLLFRV